MPTATQLSAATGLTVAVCEQVLSDLELLLPRSLAGSEPVLPSLQLPRVLLLRSLRLRLLPISPVIRRKIVRINAKSKVLCAQSLLELWMILSRMMMMPHSTIQVQALHLHRKLCMRMVSRRWKMMTPRSSPVQFLTSLCQIGSPLLKRHHWLLPRASCLLRMLGPRSRRL